MRTVFYLFCGSLSFRLSFFPSSFFFPPFLILSSLSAKGGMDGGWFFPVEIALKLAIEAADPGESVKKVSNRTGLLPLQPFASYCFLSFFNLSLFLSSATGPRPTV